MSQNQANEKLKEARRRMNESKNEAAEARQKWMESVARTKIASLDSRDEEKQFNLLLNNMNTKQAHRKLTLLTKGPRMGLNYIQVPTKVWY